jgi:hypothetical protein
VFVTCGPSRRQTDGNTDLLRGDNAVLADARRTPRGERRCVRATCNSSERRRYCCSLPTWATEPRRRRRRYWSARGTGSTASSPVQTVRSRCRRSNRLRPPVTPSFVWRTTTSPCRLPNGERPRQSRVPGPPRPAPRSAGLDRGSANRSTRFVTVQSRRGPTALRPSHMVGCKSFSGFARTPGESPVHSYNRPYQWCFNSEIVSPLRSHNCRITGVYFESCKMQRANAARSPLDTSDLFGSQASLVI